MTSGVYNGKPKITPWQMKETDQEWYLCLLGDRALRDLKVDPTMYQANRDARERESSPTKNNPIFTGGGLIYDGVYYLNIPEITQRLLLSGVGASSIDVEPVFMLGQGAHSPMRSVRCRAPPSLRMEITTSSPAWASRRSTASPRSPRLRWPSRAPRLAISSTGAW
jgi:hypothetical protein